MIETSVDFIKNTHTQLWKSAKTHTVIKQKEAYRKIRVIGNKLFPESIFGCHKGKSKQFSSISPGHTTGARFPENGSVTRFYSPGGTLSVSPASRRGWPGIWNALRSTSKAQLTLVRTRRLTIMTKKLFCGVTLYVRHLHNRRNL